MSWELTNLQEVTSKIGDGLHGTPMYDENGEYYFINGNNLRQGRIEFKDDTKKINFQEYQKIKKELNNQTVFVAINGTLGNVGLYNGEKIALGKSACYLNVNENIEKLFIRYVLENDSFQSYAQRFATGATIKNLGLKAVRDYEFNLPPLQTQKRIADILNGYDDLIENNLKRIKLLEHAAQNIYKEWFVHLRFPGHENTPTNEKTGLPEDWGNLKLKDIIEYKVDNRGRNPKYYTESGIPVIDNFLLKDEAYVKISECKRYIDDELFESFIRRYLKPKDILITLVGNGYGSVSIAPKTKSVIIQNTIGLRCNKLCSQYFLYCYLFQNKSDIRSRNRGAAQPSVKVGDLLDMDINIPVLNLINKFTEIVNPNFQLIETLGIQNQSLKTARDILLPRLMNRTIEV
jgi:type I restriction enzyme S subunit